MTQMDQASEPFRILPWRHIAFSANAGIVTIKSYAPDGDVLGLLSKDTPVGPVISEDQVAVLLKAHRLPQRRTSVARICWFLNLMRVTVPASAAAPHDPFRRLPEAISIILADAPKAVGDAIGFPKTQQSGLVSAIEALLAAAKALQPYAAQQVTGRHRHQAWHDDAMLLLFLVREAEAFDGSTGPSSFGGSTSNGVLFIRDALHLATGSRGVDGDRIRKAIGRYFRVPAPLLAIDI